MTGTTTHSRTARILVLTPNLREGEALRCSLAEAGLAPTGAETLTEAQGALGREAFDLVLFSSELPDGGAAEVLSEVAARAPDRWIPALALADGAQAAQLLALGTDDVLAPSLAPAEVLARVQARLRIQARLDGLRQENLTLSRRAITDGLTGLYNHQHFQDRADEEFRRALRYAQPLALLMIDLDAFKQVNDTHGHPVGDAVLRHASAVFREQLRDTDVLARYGGEEFAALLPQTPSPGAARVAHRLRAALEHTPFSSPGAPAFQVTASVGVSVAPAGGVTTPEALIARADAALYQAKRAGRNQVAGADPELSH